MSRVDDALLQAVDAVSGELPELAGRLEDRLDVPQPEGEQDPRARDQFMRAFIALLREGIEGGREQRELVMSTAVPALVQAGQSPTDLVHSHVAFFMILGPRLIEHMPEDLRDEGSLWLACYAAEYTREVLQIAQEASS